MEKIQFQMPSRLGNIYLVVGERGLQGIYWQPQDVPLVRQAAGNMGEIARQTVLQLQQYFAGTRQQFHLPLYKQGSAFQQRVWQALLDIPYGQTCSYKSLACALNKQGASRAVGHANSKNPLCIVVPCHRVIAADGTLGGYGGGRKIKQQLLSLEKQLG